MNMGNWAKNLSQTLWDRVAPDYHGLPPFQGLWQQLSAAAAPELGWQLSLAVPNPQAGGAGAAVMALR